jgi:undecaprenyl-diphosphatase
MFEYLEQIDRSVLLAINRTCHPVMDEFFWYVSEVWVFFPVFIFLIWFIYKQKGIRYLNIAFLSIALIILFCDQTTNLVKHKVQRYRPTHNLEICNQVHIVHDYRGGQYGFFSGHSSNTTGVAVFLFMLLGQMKAKHRWLIFLWPAVTEYSRMYLGVHYPSDIFTGTLCGIVYGILFYKLFEYLKKKYNAEVA